MRVPSRLWTASTDEIAGYLRSLFQADGYVSIQAVTATRRWPRAAVGLGTVSYELASGVQQLLLTLGVQSTLRTQPARGVRQPFHTVTIGTQPDRLLFAELVGFPCARKASLLRASLEIGVDNTTPRHQVRFPSVVAIETRGVMDVYDIQTESGNYLSNHIVVHNCFINSVEDTMDSILEAGQDRGHALQVRLGHGDQPVPHPLGEGEALRRRRRLRPGQLHEGLRRLRRGHQERWQDPPRGEDGDPQRRPSRHPRVHQLQGRGGEEGLGAHRRRLRRQLHRQAYNSVFFQNSQQLGARDRRVHARGESTTASGTTHRADRARSLMETFKARELLRPIAEAAARAAIPACSSTPPSTTGTPAPTPPASTPQQPLQRVHVPRRHRPATWRRLNLMHVPRTIDGEFDVEAFTHACDITITAQEIMVDNAQYPTAEDRREQPRLPAARARLRQPGRAAHGARAAVRQRRRPRLRGGHHRADVRRGLRCSRRASPREIGSVRGLRTRTASRCCG